MKLLAEVHLYGSDKGYKELSASLGIAISDRNFLSQTGFGDAHDEKMLSSFEHEPTFCIRPLPSGKFGITRCFAGPRDEGGRSTIELRTLIITQTAWDKIRKCNLSIYLNDSTIWTRNNFIQESEIAVKVDTNTVPPTVTNESKCIYSALRENPAGPFASKYSARAVDSLFALIASLPDSDTAHLSWGFRMIGTSMQLSMCILHSSIHRFGLASEINLQNAAVFKSLNIKSLYQANQSPKTQRTSDELLNQDELLPLNANHRLQKSRKKLLILSVCSAVIIAAIAGLFIWTNKQTPPIENPPSGELAFLDAVADSPKETVPISSTPNNPTNNTFPTNDTSSELDKDSAKDDPHKDEDDITSTETVDEANEAGISRTPTEEQIDYQAEPRKPQQKPVDLKSESKINDVSISYTEYKSMDEDEQKHALDQLKSELFILDDVYEKLMENLPKMSEGSKKKNKLLIKKALYELKSAIKINNTLNKKDTDSSLVYIKDLDDENLKKCEQMNDFVEQYESNPNLMTWKKETLEANSEFDISTVSDHYTIFKFPDEPSYESNSIFASINTLAALFKHELNEKDVNEKKHFKDPFPREKNKQLLLAINFLQEVEKVIPPKRRLTKGIDSDQDRIDDERFRPDPITKNFFVRTSEGEDFYQKWIETLNKLNTHIDEGKNIFNITRNSEGQAEALFLLSSKRVHKLFLDAKESNRLKEKDNSLEYKELPIAKWGETFEQINENQYQIIIRSIAKMIDMYDEAKE